MRFSQWVTGGRGDQAYAEKITIDAPSHAAAEKSIRETLDEGEQVRGRAHEERGPGGLDITQRRET